jgi:hypothetical protein
MYDTNKENTLDRTGENRGKIPYSGSEIRDFKEF